MSRGTVTEAYEEQHKEKKILLLISGKEWFKEAPPHRRCQLLQFSYRHLVVSLLHVSQAIFWFINLGQFLFKLKHFLHLVPCFIEFAPQESAYFHHKVLVRLQDLDPRQNVSVESKHSNNLKTRTMTRRSLRFENDNLRYTG